MAAIVSPPDSISDMIRIWSEGWIAYRNGLASAFRAGYTRVASPLVPETMPQHSLGASSRAWEIISSRSVRAIRIGPAEPTNESPVGHAQRTHDPCSGD